jgi:hypothetical protein
MSHQSRRQSLVRIRQAQHSNQSTKIPSGNEVMERHECETKNLQCGRFSSLTEPSHRELQEIGVKVGWAVRGHREVKARGIPPLELPM